MKHSCVHPFVRLSLPAATRRCFGFAAVNPAGRRSIERCTAGGQQQPRRMQHRATVWLPDAGSATLSAGHRLVYL